MADRDKRRRRAAFFAAGAGIRETNARGFQCEEPHIGSRFEKYERGGCAMTGRTEEELEGVTLLGNQGTRYVFEYSPSLLEVFENKHPDRDYFVKFNCPEFTSLCPKTGQPDFATIYISYIPDRKMVESKSLKLYLFSFRNHGDFHEDCVNIIMNDLIAAMEPRYIEVWGKFTPRGGISIDPYCNWGRPGTKYEKMAEYRLLNHDLYPEKVDNR
jgi:7-cyano-7-deazaguanine reductase